MQSILLISHGQMANGVKDALSMFFGNIKQLESLTLLPEMGADEFGNMIKEKLNDLSCEDGTIIFCDVLGGTPYNQASMLLDENIDLIVGMNLPMLMEFLAVREFNKVEVDHLVDLGKQAIVNVKAMLSQESCEVDDD